MDLIRLKIQNPERVIVLETSSNKIQSCDFYFDPKCYYVCKLCKQAFHNLEELMGHKRKYHTREELEGIKCIIFEERCMNAEYANELFIPPEDDDDVDLTPDAVDDDPVSVDLDLDLDMNVDNDVASSQFQSEAENQKDEQNKMLNPNDTSMKIEYEGESSVGEDEGSERSYIGPKIDIDPLLNLPTDVDIVKENIISTVTSEPNLGLPKFLVSYGVHTQTNQLLHLKILANPNGNDARDLTKEIVSSETLTCSSNSDLTSAPLKLPHNDEQKYHLSFPKWLKYQAATFPEKKILVEPDPLQVEENSQNETESDPIYTFVINAENPIKCKFCCRIFKSEFNTRYHLNRCYLNESGHKYCLKCDRTFPSPSFLRNHNERKHRKADVDATQFKCELCRKLFTSKIGLHRHLKRHTNPVIERFVCKYCDETFQDIKSLLKHGTIHSGSKKDLKLLQLQKQKILKESKYKFFCEMCPQRFSMKSALQKHIQSHQD